MINYNLLLATETFKDNRTTMSYCGHLWLQDYTGMSLGEVYHGHGYYELHSRSTKIPSPISELAIEVYPTKPK